MENSLLEKIMSLKKISYKEGLEWHDRFSKIREDLTEWRNSKICEFSKKLVLQSSQNLSKSTDEEGKVFYDLIRHIIGNSSIYTKVFQGNILTVKDIQTAIPDFFKKGNHENLAKNLIYIGIEMVIKEIYLGAEKKIYAIVSDCFKGAEQKDTAI